MTSISYSDSPEMCLGRLGLTALQPAPGNGRKLFGWEGLFGVMTMLGQPLLISDFGHA